MWRHAAVRWQVQNNDINSSIGPCRFDATEPHLEIDPNREIPNHSKLLRMYGIYRITEYVALVP